MAMEKAIKNTRIRIYFDDSTILNKTLKKLGLKRSWLLLKPHHHTIADVVYDIIHGFNLHHSFPHGILLTMDGFVLPPFESTIILKDKDLVRVKRKRLGMKAITKPGHFIADDIVEKQPLPSDVRLLAIEELDKEVGGYENEIGADQFEAKEPVQSEEKEPMQRSGDVASKKRKASSPIEISKTKRLRQVRPKSAKKDIDHCEDFISPQKKRNNAGDNKGEVIVKSINNSEPRSESYELDEQKEVVVHASAGIDGPRKVSRSTWRNMRKRHWKRVSRTNNEEGEKKHPMKDLGKVSGLITNVDANIEQSAEEDCDADVDLVPVEIRPGHIRFASASKAKDVPQGQETNGWDVKKNQENCWVQKNQEANGWDAQSTQKGADHSAQENVWDSDKNEVAKETFCWNGITNKRKDQKWGKENQPSWKEPGDHNGQDSNSRVTSNHSTSSTKQAKDHITQSSNTWASRQKWQLDSSMDFEKLMPLIDLPKVGDVVAYRLLELSSSWCPELSSFRVGKVALFDQETNNIMLVPEAEYPLNLGTKADNDHDDDNDSGQPLQPSVYNEDGLLEIDLPSLVDVRIVKSAHPSHSGGTRIPSANGASGSSGMSKSTSKLEDGSKKGSLDTGSQELHTPINPANGKKDVWEEISEALSAKKAQLLQEDALNKNESSTKRSWSHRTLKSSALGPTMAMLRSENGV